MRCHVDGLMRSLSSIPAAGQVSAGNQGINPCVCVCREERSDTIFTLHRLRDTDYVDLSAEAAQAGCAGLPRRPVEEKE